MVKNLVFYPQKSRFDRYYYWVLAAFQFAGICCGGFVLTCSVSRDDMDEEAADTGTCSY